MDRPPVPRLIHAANPGPLTANRQQHLALDGGEPALIDAGIGRPDHIARIRDALGRPAPQRVLVTHGHRGSRLRCSCPSRRMAGSRGRSRFAPANDQSGWTACRRRSRARRRRGTDGRSHARSRPGSRLFLGSGRRRSVRRGHGARRHDRHDPGRARREPSRLHGVARADPRARAAAHSSGPWPGRRGARRAESSTISPTGVRAKPEVLAIVRLGMLDVDAIVGRIYPTLAVTLRPAARVTVRAHLDKLREEGRLPRP